MESTLWMGTKRRSLPFPTSAVEHYVGPPGETAVTSERSCVCVCVGVCVGVFREGGRVTSMTELRGTQGTRGMGTPSPPRPGSPPETQS